jgi:plastocyanin
MKKTGLLLAAICIAAALTACGSESTTQEGHDTGTATATAEDTSAPAAASVATITIADMKFGESVTVPPGAQITVKNDDSVEHSVTSETEGKFNVHVDGGKEKPLTAPTEPGEYPFYCVYHPNMKGTLIVK